MNIIQNQRQLHQHCHNACFQLDFNKRQYSTNLVLSFSSTLIKNKPQLDIIFKSNTPETTLFVLSQSIYKQLKNAEDVYIQPLIGMLVEQLNQKYNLQGQFIHNNQKLQSYTVKSLFRLLGYCFKKVYKIQADKEAIFKECHFQTNFSLIFWKEITSVFGAIDYDMGFLNYRSMIYFYQDHAIPKAIHALLPYFQAITETVEINQLSKNLGTDVHIQNNMIYQESKVDRSSNRKYIQFNQTELFTAKIVLDLAQQIFQFPYSITYGEYDLDIYYHNSVIYYPQPIMKIIMNSSFYQSLFYLAQRLMIQKPQDQMLTICLSCLKKMVLTRTTFLSKQKKDQFIYKTFKGIVQLMRISLKQSSQSMLIHVLQLNNKIINNINLKKLRKYPQFQQWITLIESIFHLMLKLRPLKYNDHVHILSFQLMVKIQMGFKHPKIFHLQPKIHTIFLNYLNFLLLSILYQQQSFINKTNVYQIKQIKSYAGQFFGFVRQIILYNFQESIWLIHQAQTKIFDNLNIYLNANPTNQIIFNMNSLINMNHLVNQLISPIVINCITNTSIKNQTLQYLKTIISTQVIHLNSYLNFNDTRLKNNQELNISSIIFLEHILVDLCSNISFVPKIEVSNTNNLPVGTSSSKSKSKPTSRRQVNETMRNNSKILQLLSHPSSETQILLNDNFALLLKYLQTSNPQQISYVLEILNKCIIKMKYNVKAAYFKKLSIMSTISQYCYQLIRSNFQTKQLMKSRAEVMKLITIMYFDEMKSQYKTKLDQFFNNINSDNVILLIYDLLGITKQIDSITVYKYFLQKSKDVIINILQYMIKNYSNNYPFLKLGIKLCKYILQNLYNRILCNKKLCSDIYVFIQEFIPYLNLIIGQFQDQMTLAGSYCDIEVYLSCSNNILGCLKNILDGKYINIFCLAQDYNLSIDQYVILNMKHINTLMKHQACKYPKTKNIIIFTSKLIIQELPQYIYQIQSLGRQSIQQYSKLFINCISLMYQQLNNYISQPKNKQNRFIMIADFLVTGLMYQQQVIIQYHNQILSLSSEIFQQLLWQYLSQMIVPFLLTYSRMDFKISKVAMDKLALFIGWVFRVYKNQKATILNKIQEMITESNCKLIHDFWVICQTGHRVECYYTLNLWREGLVAELLSNNNDM